MEKNNIGARSSMEVLSRSSGNHEISQFIIQMVDEDIKR